MNGSTSPIRTFSPWARWALGTFATALALVLVLWASTQTERWKFALPLVFFAIAGANVLPIRAARWCGKLVAITLAMLSGYALVSSLAGTTTDIMKAIAICLMFGLPAVLYLAADILPYGFGGQRPNTSLERTREK